MTVELWFEVGQLFLHRPHLCQSLPAGSGLGKNLPAQLELLFKVASRRGGTRVHHDLQRLSQSLSVNGEAHLISAWNRARATRGSILISSGLCCRLGAGVAPGEIPHETMRARSGLKNFRFRKPALGDG